MKQFWQNKINFVREVLTRITCNSGSLTGVIKVFYFRFKHCWGNIIPDFPLNLGAYTLASKDVFLWDEKQCEDVWLSQFIKLQGHLIFSCVLFPVGRGVKWPNHDFQTLCHFDLNKVSSLAVCTCIAQIRCQEDFPRSSFSILTCIYKCAIFGESR